MSVSVIESGITKIIASNNVCSIPLTNSSIPCFIDDSDYEIVTKNKWYLDGKGYVRNTTNAELLHRFLLSADRKKVIHHINGIKTDNRRCNLEVLTVNEHNRLHKLEKEGIFRDYKGVTLRKNRKKCFMARIRYGNGKRFYLGSYIDPITAEIVYNLH